MSDIFSVGFNPGAVADLEAIADYLADARGEDAALAFIATIAKRVETLSRFPMRGSVPRELDDNDDDFRQILFGRYRIVCEVEGDGVTIVLVADGRRDMQALLRARLLGAASSA